MPVPEAEFAHRLASLRGDLADEARAVRRELEAAVDSVFEKDPDKARRAIEADEQVDRLDVRIEREAVQLLCDAIDRGARIDAGGVRTVFTLVKVNNELERIGDCAVAIAQRVDAFVALPEPPPPTFRVMANSVIGILQTTSTALSQFDTVAAELVLMSDDATDAFKRAILQDTEEALARGSISVEYAVALQAVASSLGRVADHCTNIAEQVIYVQTGKVVRHEGDRWTKPAPSE